MKKALALLICLLMLTAAACGSVSETEPSSDEGIVAISTPVPNDVPPASAAPAADASEGTQPVITLAPSEETPAPTFTPEPRIPSNADEAVDIYQGYALGYTRLYRDPVKPNHPIAEPRYTLSSDGIYRNAASTNDNEAVIMLTGDLMCQTRQQEAYKKGSGYDFSGCYAFVKDLFSKADLVAGNLEATLSASSPYMAEQTHVDGSPHLNAPAVYLEAIRDAGYDLVAMANNHNCDAGVRGIYETLDQVDHYRLMHTGTFRNANEPRYVVVEVDGIRIGFLSYATYYNHKEERLTNEGRSILLNYYSPERVKNDVAAVRAAGAEYVMAYIHWGVEYKNDPSLIFSIPMTEKISGKKYTLRVDVAKQPGIAQGLADSGVDYILGSHPHALQPYTVITASDGRKVPCIYSLGNFVSHQSRDITRDTIILRIILTRDSSGRVILSKEGYVPARSHKSYGGYSYTVLPITYPYRKSNYSNEFSPAYYRITGVIGPKLPIMGTL